MENMCKEYVNVVHVVLISVLHFGSGGVGNRQWGQYTVQNTKYKISNRITGLVYNVSAYS